METRSDELLLSDHLAGKPGAFDCLVARYAPELFGFLCRLVANAAAADDLIQDTFMQVHLSASTFDPTRRFRPWLYTIAANKGRDFLRSRGRRQEYSLEGMGSASDGSDPAQNLPATDEPITDSVETDEQRVRVRILIDTMPEHLRLILMLGYFQQLPYADIAQILEIPVGTVKSRLHSAVNHFARLWNGQEQADAQAPR